MKECLNNKLKNVATKHKYSGLLIIIICILFLVTGYSNTDIDYELYINENNIECKYEIQTQNNEIYIHIEDLISNFRDNIYDDKISGKLIITTQEQVIKINKTDEQYVLGKDDENYFNLNKIIDSIGNKLVISKGKVYILDVQTISGKIKINRTELIDKQDQSILCILSKQDNIKVYVDYNLTSEEEKLVSISTTVDGKTYYGQVLKKNISYDFENNVSVEQKQKIILAKADNRLANSTDINKVDIVAINMYRLSGVDTLAKLEYINNVPDNIKVIATINNGQKSSNYDSDILTSMLHSESNRQKIIGQIEKLSKNVAGINLDFSSFKVSDKQYYTQFIKELAAVMRANKKLVIVNVPSTQYIDINEVSKHVDYVILQPYEARTIASKTSGPISSLAYVEQTIQQAVNTVEDVNKIILEIPTHTILWTERRGTVINAEQYSMKMMQEYIKENNIEYKLDSVSGQNYFNYTKGITTYKMWLEDIESIKNKALLVNKYNLAGISIYKSGMELKEIYDSISKEIKK